MKANTTKFVIVIISLLIAMGCSQSGKTGSVDYSNQVREIIEQKTAALERYYAEGKIDLAAMAFAEDAWQMSPNALPLIGRDAYHESWSQAVQWGSWQFNLKTQEVVAEGSIAVERGKYTVKFEANADSPTPSFEDRGNYVVFWRLDADGEWRAVWDAPVSDVPYPCPELPIEE